MRKLKIDMRFIIDKKSKFHKFLYKNSKINKIKRSKLHSLLVALFHFARMNQLIFGHSTAVIKIGELPALFQMLIGKREGSSSFFRSSLLEFLEVHLPFFEVEMTIFVGVGNVEEFESPFVAFVRCCLFLIR